MIDTDFFNEPHAVVERGAPVFVQDGSVLPKKNILSLLLRSMYRMAIILFTRARY